MSMGKILKISIVLILFSFAFVSIGSVYAEEKIMAPTTTGEKDVLVTGTRAKAVKETVMMKKTVKLSQARLNVCKTKSNVISERMSNLRMLGAKVHQDRSAIVQKIDTYYNEKLVPQGLVLSNYDTLKSDIATKQANVQTALAKVQESGKSFSCDSEDPKADADTFRADMQALILAQKEYKLAVKNFAIAVRGLTKSIVTPGVSVSPAATQAPVVE